MGGREWTGWNGRSHAFRHVVLPDLVLRMIPVSATGVLHVSVQTHLIVVRPHDCNIVDGKRIVIIHFYQYVFGLLRGVLLCSTLILA